MTEGTKEVDLQCGKKSWYQSCPESNNTYFKLFMTKEKVILNGGKELPSLT